MPDYYITFLPALTLIFPKGNQAHEKSPSGDLGVIVRIVNSFI
jgi:hypothetical protein